MMVMKMQQTKVQPGTSYVPDNSTKCFTLISSLSLYNIPKRSFINISILRKLRHTRCYGMVQGDIANK